MRTLLIALLTARALAQQPPAASDCAIDGTVTNSVTGEPVPRAQVTLHGATGPSSRVADSAGRWSFLNVNCGQTQVTATRPGFLPSAQGLARAGMILRPLVLSSGSARHDVKVQLTPQAVVSGKVVDEAGDPILGARVTVLLSQIVAGRRTFQAAGSTNSNDLGEYRLPSLAGARYIVCVDSPPGGVVTLAERCYPGPVEGGLASAMDLPPGRDARVDFTLSRAATVHVRGTITGLPKGQSVGLSMVARGGAGANSAWGRSVNLRPDGAFDMPDVAPGSYWLTCDHYEGGQRISARVPVDVGSADVEGVTVHLQPGFSVTGTVRFESKDAPPQTNQPINVSLRSSDLAIGGGRFQWGSDRSTFTIDQLTPGNYKVEVFSQGAYFLKSATLSGRDILHDEIPISQAAGPIELVLSDSGGSIDATVEDSKGQPVESWVMLLQEGRQPRNLRTGPDGHLKAANLAPGPYTLTAWDDWQQVEYANPDWMRRNASGVEVTVEAGQTAQVQVTQAIAPDH